MFTVASVTVSVCLSVSVKSLSITDRDFITRMIYKDIYYADTPLLSLNSTVCMHV